MKIVQPVFVLADKLWFEQEIVSQLGLPCSFIFVTDLNDYAMQAMNEAAEHIAVFQLEFLPENQHEMCKGLALSFTTNAIFWDKSSQENEWNTALIQALKTRFLQITSTQIRAEVSKKLAPKFNELSQCLLQINADVGQRSLSKQLLELDRLYLEMRPILDAFHVIDALAESEEKLNFPLLEKIRFLISRYQYLSNGKLVFAVESNLMYSDFIQANYQALTTLLELLFCFSLIHTEYGIVTIQVKADADGNISVSLTDTGAENVDKWNNYRQELEYSYESLAIFLALQLGFSLIINKSELAGFDINLTFSAVQTKPSKIHLVDKKQIIDTTKITTVQSEEQELQRHYRELINNLEQVVNEKYTPGKANDWRKIMHRIWPSVEMMGDKILANQIRGLHDELKKDPKSEHILVFQKNIKSELMQFFHS